MAYRRRLIRRLLFLTAKVQFAIPHVRAVHLVESLITWLGGRFYKIVVNQFIRVYVKFAYEDIFAQVEFLFPTFDAEILNLEASLGCL